jgi:uncharacterized membrane protein YraQ (UPF0718 family)
MNGLFTVVLYILTILLLLVSFFKNKEKTYFALRKAVKMFITVLPQFIAILLLMGVALSIFDADFIEIILGANSGLIGTVVSAVIGSIALVPVLIAFPIASELLESGAGLIPVTVFISTLTTVGIVTIPLESKILGRKVALLRNALFFVFSFFIAFVVNLISV